MAKVEYQLPDGVAKSYALAPGAPGEFINQQVGYIDVRELTEAKCESLIAAGSRHIVKLEQKAEKKAAAAN